MSEQLSFGLLPERRSRRSQNFVTTHQAIVFLRKRGWTVTPQAGDRHRIRQGNVDLMNLEDNQVRFAARQQGLRS